MTLRSSVSFSETFGIKMDLTAVFERLKIQRNDRILDIGAYKNEMVEIAQSKGFINAVGIDVAPEILCSRYGRQINFRDMPIHEKFRVICFNEVLNHFPGGIFNKGTQPALSLLAGKIYLHLPSEGYLIFGDSANNVPAFIEELLLLGFKRLDINVPGLYIFQKN